MTPCPQCSSLWCGAWACRFSGLAHGRAAEQQRIAAYANAAIARDKRPQWEREHATGARDPSTDY